MTKKPTWPDLKANLQARRARAGLTQAELAEKAGLARITIALIESAAGGGISLESATAIAKALDCSVEELLGPRAETSPSPPGTHAS